MTTTTYKCEGCGQEHTTERAAWPPLLACRTCGADMRPVLADQAPRAPSAQFRHAGWGLLVRGEYERARQEGVGVCNACTDGRLCPHAAMIARGRLGHYVSTLWWLRAADAIVSAVASIIVARYVEKRGA